MDYTYANLITGDAFTNYAWNVNKNFLSSDTAYNFDLRFAAVQFDTLIDFNYNTGTVNSSIARAGHVVRLDSFQLYYNHTRTVTSSTDTLYMYVYDLSQGRITGTAPNDAFAPTTWLWKDSIKVTGTNNINSLGNNVNTGLYELSRKPNLTLPAGHSFGIYIEFRGNRGNYLQVLGGGRDACAGACGVNLSYVDTNTLYYMCYKSPSTGTVFSGINTDVGIYYDCDASGSLTLGSCEYFYLQTFAIPAYVTVTTSGVQQAPTVVTTAASSVTTTTATLNGTVNAQGASSTVSFDWGLTTSYGNSAAATPSPVTGSSTTSVSANLSGLTPNTTYHFRVKATNTGGTSYGNDLTFTTQQSSGGGTTCIDTIFMDYNRVDEITATNNGLSFYGSWYATNIQPYANELSSFVTIPSSDQGYMSYAAVAFDTISYYDGNSSSIVTKPLSTSTLTLDSITAFCGLWGDSTKMANDSLLFKIYAINSGVIATTPVKTLVFKGFNQLRPFYVPAPNYLLPVTVPASQQFTQGQGFAIRMDYRNKDTSSHFTLGYSFADSCNTVILGGNSFLSPAYPSVFQGSSYWGEIDSVAPTSASVRDIDNTYAYDLSAYNIPATCSFVYPQNFEIVPTVKICYQAQSSTCTPATGTTGLTPDASNVNCISQGSSFSQTYTLVVPSSISTVTVVSITINNITGLPNGLTWTPGVNPDVILGGTTGCYMISGITNDLCGQYLLNINVTISVLIGGTPQTFTGDLYTLAQQYGISGVTAQYLRVIYPGNSCPALNTSQTVSFSAYSSCSAQLNATASGTNVNCFGQSTGSATVTVTGGTGTNSYLWSPGGGTTATISNLAAGTYTVTVTSGTSTATASYTVTQPSSALFVNVNTTNTSCSANTGTATASAGGGTPNYTYLWSPGGGTTSTISNLAAANYVVTVTDANQCTASASKAVSLPTPYTLTVTTTAVNCYGQNTGSATAVPTGASGNVTYLWNNSQTSGTISNLAANTYTVTSTDGNGCTATAQGTVTQPASALTANTSSTQTTCGQSTGTATVTAAGGTPGYTYHWYDNSTGTTISNLAVGNYAVTVTDNHQCTVATTASVSSPANFTLTVTGTDINCFGQNTGTATATVIGGTGITYSWNPGGSTSSQITGLSAGTYNVTVTDNQNCARAGSYTVVQPSSAVTASATATQTQCNSTTGTATVTANGGTPGYSYSWNNSLTGSTISNLGAATYTVTVSDSHSCTATASATVTLPAPYTVSVTVSNVNCYGQSTGSATATANGGVSPYSYFWTNGHTTQVNTGLAANTYTVTVTDANGCTSTGSGTVTQPNSGITATVSTTQTSCTASTGTATVSASGGTGQLTYVWSAGNQTTATISNLSAGNYVVTVTDGGQCTVSAIGSVSSPATFTLNVTTTDVQCYGASTGSATSAVSGGTGPFTYLWNNNATSPSLTSIPAGTYTLTVTDANGCSKAASGTVNQPATALVVNVTTTNSSCNQTTGSATATVIGATGTPTYLWSNGATSSSLSGLGVNSYSVTVTSAGCTATASGLVNNSNGPSVTIVHTDPRCFASNDGSATAVASGGQPNYTYTWSTTATGSSLTNIGAGTYTVLVQDNTGCQAIGSVTLTQPGAITGNPSVTNVNCFGDATGSISLAAGGGTGPYTYGWSVGGSQNSISSQPAGSYTVTITDSRSCTAVSTITISQPNAALSVNIATTPTSGANGTATANVSGGTLPYNYAWSNTQTTSGITGLAAGTYTVTITDIKGCTATATASVVNVGIGEVGKDLLSVTVFPNPANDVLRVMVEASNENEVEYHITDMTGKIVYTAHNSVNGKTLHEINVSQFAAGVYVIETAIGNEMARTRFVVNR